MNIPLTCRINEGTKQQTDVFTRQFLRTVLEQQRRAKELHQHEIQSTAENPRIREQNETTDISLELKELRHEEFVSHKRRQQLRANNHELRQLEHQLQIAVTAKNLAEQLNFAEETKKQNELMKRTENENAEKERLRNLQIQLETEEKERSKRSQLRASLLQQINSMKEKRKQEYSEVMREREQMQKLLRHYDEDRENEQKDAERRKKETYQMMQDFLRDHENFKAQMKLQNQTDDSLMLKLLDEREQARQRLFEERRQKWDKHAALSNCIGQKVYQTTEEKRKRENLLLDLLVEERNANEELRYRLELEKREEQRRQMRSELERYLGEDKHYKAQMQKQEEETWNLERKRVEEKEQKEDKLKEEERQKRMLDYQRAILQLIEERRLLRKMSAAEERNLYEDLIKEQMKLDDEVQKERLRLLQSCSPDILRYLPAGVITESDKKSLDLTTKLN